MKGLHLLRTAFWGAAAAVVLLVLVLPGAGRAPHIEAAPFSPACTADLRHLSWVWHFPVDGTKETVAQKLAASGMGVIMKTHDGTDWMSRYDSSPDAVTGPAKVRQLADFFESRGAPFFTYAVVKGEDPIREAQMAAQVLNSGARGIVLDLEPWAAYWRGTPESARVFGQELRRLAPNGMVITAVEPRPWVVTRIPVAEFAAFSNALATMDYWDSYQSNGSLFAAHGYPTWPRGHHARFPPRRRRRATRPL